MLNLRALEQHFQSHLLHGAEDILAHVKGTCKVPVEVRLEIYKNAYQLRLQETLSTSYPMTQCILGEEPFEALCYDYIDANPSQHRSLRWFGDKFPCFLQTHPSTKENPYLAELALFEWILALSFDAPDAPIITLDDMLAVPPNDWAALHFNLHPSVHLRSFSWNVVSLWQALTHGDPLPPLKKFDAPLDWVIWRDGLEVFFSSMPKEEAWAIKSIKEGLMFGLLCDGMCQWVDETQAGLHTASLLKGWITAGLLTQNNA